MLLHGIYSVKFLEGNNFSPIPHQDKGKKKKQNYKNKYHVFSKAYDFGKFSLLKFVAKSK